MRSRHLAPILLVIVQLIGAASPPTPAGPFPEAPTATAPERTVQVPVGTRATASIASYRFKPRPGLTRWFAAEWCGVTIETGRTTSKPILVIGTGQTGSVTCLGLKGAGVMPPDGRVGRIGLVYRTASPNFRGVTPVLLASDPATGDWTVDHSHDDEFGRILPEPSLESMRRILVAGQR